MGVGSGGHGRALLSPIYRLLRPLTTRDSNCQLIFLGLKTMKQLLWQIPFLNVVLNVDEHFKYFFYLALQLTQCASLLYLFGCSMRQYGSFVTDYT